MIRINHFAAEYIFVGGLVLLLGIMLFPVLVVRVQNPPKEDEKYIRRIYDNHSVGQVFVHDYYRIKGIDVVVRANSARMALLIASDARGTRLGEVSLSLTSNDQWISIPFKKSLPKGTDTVTFTTEAGTSIDNAILLRVQPDSTLYDMGNMVVDGTTSYGDIAFRAIERLPVWRAILVWGQVNATSMRATMFLVVQGVAGAGVLFALMSMRIKRFASAHLVISVLAIFIIALIVRAPYVEKIQGVFGGDAFNYMSKGYALLHGGDPFAADPRKGILYSLLLIPGFLTSDPLVWSRWVGIVAAALTAGLVPLVGRRMGMPLGIALMAGVLTACSEELIWEAPSGLAMTLFTLLILFSVYAYLQIARSQRWLWVLAASAGLTMLTRFEGALVGAVLLPAAWVRYRIPWKKMIWPVVLAGLLMALPLSSLLWSGKSGIRTPQDIANDDGLFLVHSIWDEQLELNIERSYEFFTNVWVWKGENMNIAQWLGIGLASGFAVIILQYALPRRHSYLFSAIGALSAGAFLFFLAMNNELNKFLIVAMLYILTGIGIVLFVKKRPVDAFAMLLAIATQIAVIIWVLPKTRYFLPTIPFLYLFLAYGIHTLIPSKKKIVQFAVMAIMAAAAIFFLVDSRNVLDKRAEKYNNQAQDNHVMLGALRDLRASHMRIGAPDLEELDVAMYIPRSDLFVFKPSGSNNLADQELQFIKQNNMQYLFERDRKPQWQIVREHPELFANTKTYTTKNGDSKVFVYQVRGD
ncbi:MAG: hypothetical protein A3E36_04745 [Candidatus Andersenbacteria bacterium RIFCSPHIGHO2_12_FULL_45_11b]|uniref:Glycosyltransferase RgtA/B/C/D-like domain-containing protein n=1 Tax=Candidatus Andersenbacteria bacterium RIFCSPHIGHO2_12_FULL_45_11b TaxID=1797282 RepID=A0A1G1XBV2_9BACT|nr:MAG: hypothetical protein A3E36_04745 [Candidatus Andersenbacteria bacterium RIFCSPHIGHO2_12_FULL_45_11b]